MNDYMKTKAVNGLTYYLSADVIHNKDEFWNGIDGVHYSVLNKYATFVLDENGMFVSSKVPYENLIALYMQKSKLFSDAVEYNRMKRKLKTIKSLLSVAYDTDDHGVREDGEQMIRRLLNDV